MRTYPRPHLIRAYLLPAPFSLLDFFNHLQYMTALGMSCTTPLNTRYMRSENAKSVEAHAEYDSYYLPAVRTPRMPYPSLPSFHELSLPGHSESRHTGSTNFVEAPLRRSTPTHSGRSLCGKSSSLSHGTSTGGMSKSNVDPGPAQKQKRRRQILSCTGKCHYLACYHTDKSWSPLTIISPLLAHAVKMTATMYASHSRYHRVQATKNKM